MFANAVLWMILLSKVATFFTIVAVFACIACAGFGIAWACFVHGEYCNDEDHAKMSRRTFKWLLGIAIVTVFIACGLPRTGDMLLYAGFSAVDQYNAKHENSKISVDGIVGTASDLIGIFDSALKRVDAIVNPPKPETDAKK